MLQIFLSRYYITCIGLQILSPTGHPLPRACLQPSLRLPALVTRGWSLQDPEVTDVKTRFKLDSKLKCTASGTEGMNNLYLMSLCNSGGKQKDTGKKHLPYLPKSFEKRSPPKLTGLFRNSIFLMELQGKTSVSIFQTAGLPLKWGLEALERLLTLPELAKSPQQAQMSRNAFKNLQ